MNKKFSAFTLAELLIVLAVIGVLAVATINSVDVSDINSKKAKLISQDFYSSIEQAYLQITNVEKVRITDSDAETINKKILNHINGITTDCNNFGNATYNGNNISLTDAKCAKTSNGTMFATFVKINEDKKCEGNLDTTTIPLLEFKEEGKTETSITGACGYIIYKTPNSTGVFGEDLFTIALGKKGIKN